jgi:hypothetical protein
MDPLKMQSTSLQSAPRCRHEANQERLQGLGNLSPRDNGNVTLSESFDFAK